MKFRLLEKVKYMIFGALLTLFGFVLGNLSNYIEAHSEGELIDTLHVGKLNVYDSIRVINGNRKVVVLISQDESGGTVTVSDGNSEPVVLISQDESGGTVVVHDKLPWKNSLSSLVIAEEGGMVLVKSASGEGVAAMSIQDGDGFVGTIDKLGNRRELK